MMGAARLHEGGDMRGDLGNLVGVAPRAPFRRGAGTPVHAQIEQWFMAAIEAGDLGPGDRLPPEQALAVSLGVSRMTLRQALATLEARGVLERIPGRRGGTFILEPRLDCDLTGLTGLTEQLRRARVRAGARIVRAETVPAGRDVAAALEVVVGAAVHAVERVRTARRRPMALELSYFPASAFPDLLDQPLGGSLYALLRRRYGDQPRQATEFLEPVVAGDREARLLDVAAGSALMLVIRTAASASGRPVEHARDLFRPDRVRLSVRSTLS
jgi:GntR family transcriptional regulator